MNSQAVHIVTAAPSPPYDITCLESFRDSMVLGWKQPDKTSGVEITGYYVNYREVIDGVPGRWREANIKAVSDEAYKVSMCPSGVWNVMYMITCSHVLYAHTQHFVSDSCHFPSVHCMQ